MQCPIYFLVVNLTYKKLSHDESIINVHVQDIMFSKQCYLKYGQHYYKSSLEPNFLLSDNVNTCTTHVTVTPYVQRTCDSEHRALLTLM
jgi:hypothetical protein